MTIKLNTSNLEAISQNVGLAEYDQSVLSSGIVHMSIGGFHRAHQAFYIDKLLSQTPENWMITAVGLLPGDKDNIEALQSQDCMYTLVQRSISKDEPRIIRSIKNAIHAPTNPDQVIAALANPETKIVSLTVTEKGYCYDETGNLDLTNSNLQNDLTNPENPKTVYGYLIAGLKARKQDGTTPFTIMSCDNLPGNGHLTEKLVIQFADQVDKDLSNWIAENVSFPNAMVDRITPATDQTTIDLVKDKFDIEDAWPVASEDYVQWVLEDKFVNGRPALETVGVQIVEDVEPYEKMKVRLLNGSHSALSYLSYLMGYRNVDLAMADPLISKFVRLYMDEDITASVPDVPGMNLDEYKNSLIERFANPAISDQVQRLAEDGSTKIPNAIIPCIEYQLENGGSIKYACLALAGWFSYLTGTDENQEAIEINDPMVDELISTMQIDSQTCQNILKVSKIFGTTLPNNETFMLEMQKALDLVTSKGARAALENYLNN